MEIIIHLNLKPEDYLLKTIDKSNLIKNWMTFLQEVGRIINERDNDGISSYACSFILVVFSQGLGIINI